MNDDQEGHSGTRHDSAMPESIPVEWVLGAMVRERRLILGATGGVFAIALMFASLKAPTFTASFSFVPQSNQDQARSGLASLAGQFGIALGAASGGPQQSSQLYADLLRTRGVLAPIARDSVASREGDGRRVPLYEYLNITDENPFVATEYAIEALRRNVISSTVDARTTGVVTVTVRTASAVVSLGIAERLIDGLNRFNRVTRQSQAVQERRFSEGRLSAAQTNLRSAEDALQRFLQANRQFANSPELVFQRDRLQREVTLQQQVVLGLAQQSEDARIREVRDTPVLTMVDGPTLPVIRDPMGRVRAVVLWSLAAFATALFVVLIHAGWTWQAGHGYAPAAEASLLADLRSLGERFKRRQ